VIAWEKFEISINLILLYLSASTPAKILSKIAGKYTPIATTPATAVEPVIFNIIHTRDNWYTAPVAEIVWADHSFIVFILKEWLVELLNIKFFILLFACHVWTKVKCGEFITKNLFLIQKSSLISASLLVKYLGVINDLYYSWTMC